ncbi:MAG: acyl-CoA thioesterase [Bacteroidota bacterium]|nr:acyl-CoA thioesterase [Bacteroidota bacterium]
MSIHANAYQLEITVQPGHLDHLQHVNNVVYVQFLQEAAFRHWTSRVSPQMHEEVLWIVRRHEIDYLASAYLHDELVITTWTGEHTAVTWDRFYEITRKKDGKTIVTAKSVWVLLDRKTFKPRRIDAAILSVLQ